MTLLAVWARTAGKDEELIIAADSRLTGGLDWDGCPKIVSLPRTDCLLAFAGDTYLTYPLMLQVQNAFQATESIRMRRTDLTGAMNRALLILNQMRLNIDWGSREEEDYTETLFLLVGYSWRESRFRAWRLKYRKKYKKFSFLPVEGIPGLRPDTLIYFGGDQTGRATGCLASILKEKNLLTSGPIDMEPLSALLAMIEDESEGTRSIGGAPQIAKIYRHANVDHFAVRWPPGSEDTYFFGRRILAAERFDVPLMNLFDDFKVEYPKANVKGSGLQQVRNWEWLRGGDGMPTE